MRIHFVATDVDGDEDDHSIVCGVDGRDTGGIERALYFDRPTELACAEDCDWGVYIQYGGQNNSGHKCVKHCRLSRQLLSVDLQRQLGSLVGVEGFDVDLAISDEVYVNLRDCLRRIFRDLPGVLVLAEAADNEEDIAHQRLKLDAWLDEAYAGNEAQRYYGEMDASYPMWGAVETLVGSIFDCRLLQRLSPQSIESILFFISRSNEIGCIIAWLGIERGGVLSNCGHLAYDDFLFLCDAALARRDDDCDYQLVACFRKQESLNETALSRLDRFFRKSNSYTRRMVLLTFEKFSLSRTIDAAKELWNTDECEFAKLDCLHALKRFPEAKDLFDEYLGQYRERFDVDAKDYRRSHLAQLTEQGHADATDN